MLFRDQVGRVGFTTPTGPRITPVDYSIYHGDIVFGTTPYGELGTHGWDRFVVFEVDELDSDHGRAAAWWRGGCGKGG